MLFDSASRQLSRSKNPLSAVHPGHTLQLLGRRLKRQAGLRQYLVRPNEMVRRLLPPLRLVPEEKLLHSRRRICGQDTD